MRFIADALGVPPPRPAYGEEVSRRSGGSNKRCRNQRLRDSGYSFRYPSYREGLRHILT